MCVCMLYNVLAGWRKSLPTPGSELTGQTCLGHQHPRWASKKACICGRGRVQQNSAHLVWRTLRILSLQSDMPAVILILKLGVLLFCLFLPAIAFYSWTPGHGLQHGGKAACEGNEAEAERHCPSCLLRPGVFHPGETALILPFREPQGPPSWEAFKRSRHLLPVASVMGHSPSLPPSP